MLLKVSRRVFVERRRIAGANETTPALASQMRHQLIIAPLSLQQLHQISEHIRMLIDG